MGTKVASLPRQVPNVIAQPSFIVDINGDIVEFSGSAGGAAANFAVTQHALTVTPAEVLAARPGRVQASFYNTTGDTIYIGPDNSVSPTTGAPIPAGAAFNLAVTAAVYAVSATTSTLVALETF